MALVFAVLMNGGAYFFSDKIALASSGAQPISPEQSPRLYQVMERLCGKGQSPDAEALHDSRSRRRMLLPRDGIRATLRLP